jgi:two-component system OmpR family sensor kinase
VNLHPAQWSLRARLVAVVSGLLVLALLLTGAATLTLLRGVLVAQLDEQLATVTANPASLEALVQAGRRGPEAPGLPSEYAVLFVPDDGSTPSLLTSPTRDATSLPAVARLSPDRLATHEGQPFTVPADAGGGQWRVVGRQVVVSGVGPGSVAVALPLDRVEVSLARVRLSFVLAGMTVVAACVLAGLAAVHRAFRPLRDVEAVATAFGEGDTSRRVPEAPPGTEVGRLGAAVNAMLDRIETSMAAREASEARMRRFVGDASHELRTPLAAVRGFAELHRQGAVTSPVDVSRTFGRIEQEATRMGGLVEDLLTLARLDEQRPLRREPVDLLVLAADAVQDLRALAPRRQVTLRGLDGAPAPAPADVVGDDARLRQVLGNLISNAVRHTPDGTCVEIGVGTRGDWGLWQVVDHGPGIPPAEAEQVFERFYRSDASRTRTAGGGSGLGLAIVAALVRAHAGAVRVVPTDGGGATFEVALPLAKAPDTPDSQPVPR